MTKLPNLAILIQDPIEKLLDHRREM